MYLQVKVIPNAAKTELVEIMQDGEGNETWKIRLKAKREKGEANKELFRFLADHFKKTTDDIKIISGHTDSRKLVKIAEN